MKFLMLVLLFTLCDSKKYKPVVLLHGILTGNDSMVTIRDRILEVTTITVNTFLFVSTLCFV